MRIPCGRGRQSIKWLTLAAAERYSAVRPHGMLRQRERYGVVPQGDFNPDDKRQRERFRPVDTASFIPTAVDQPNIERGEVGLFSPVYKLVLSPSSNICLAS